LEGIISKRAEQPYVSGSNPGWVKVKMRSWRGANAERYKLRIGTPLSGTWAFDQRRTGTGGHVNERGQPFHPKSVAAMLEQ
jgi:hypothetical protein